VSAIVTREAAEAFAREWIAAWNAGDLERIFAHYAEDFEMRSPLIAQRGFSPDGVLRGKEAIRPYYAAGLSAQPPLHFELLAVHAGVGVVAIYYRNVTYGRLVIERIELGPDGKGVRAEGLYATAS
jgi:hypothetical protein